MSWLFSQALVEELSAGEFSVTDALVPWKLKNIPVGFSPSDRTTARLIISRFGTMLAPSDPTTPKPLITSAGLEGRYQRNSSSVAGSRSCAKTSAPPGKDLELMAIDRAYGVNLRESSVRFDRATSSWRTHRCLWEEDLPESSVTLPVWGTMLAGVVWELTTPALRTSVTACGSSRGWWPTPVSSEARQGLQIRREGKKGSQQSLSTAVVLFQTPVADDAVDREKGKVNSRGEPKLSAQVKLFPTPVADGDRTTNYAQGGTSPGHAARNWPTPHGFSPDGKSNGPSGNELGRAVNQSLRDDPQRELFPTPTASMATTADMEQARYAGNGGKRPSYEDAKLLTPKASDGERGGRGDLLQAVRGNENSHFKLWPPPRTPSKSGGGIGLDGGAGSRAMLTDEERAEVCSGSLSPDWTEKLMGWPPGWTSLDPLPPHVMHEWLQGDHWHPAWEEGLPRVVQECENRVGRLRCIGNGQVPAVLVMAWQILFPLPLSEEPNRTE